MRHSRIVFLLWALLLAGAIGTGRDLLYNLWYLLTALLLFSYLWAWASIRWVEVERSVRTTRSQVGKMTEERFVVHNRAWLPKLWLEVRDHSTLPNHHASWVIGSLRARRNYTRTVQTRCLQRGRFALGPLSLHSGDPFGLFRMSRQLDEPKQTPFIVYPAMVDVPTFASPVGLLSGGDSLRRRTFHVTTNVSGVRDYAPGDSFSRIHWPSTARAGRLISKEFELDPTSDVWLFLDLEREAQAALPTLDLAAAAVRLPWEHSSKLELQPSTVEYGVTITASLAKYFIDEERAIGFVSYSPRREIIPVDRGERQLTKMLETLAVIRAEGRIPLTEVLTAEGAHLSRNATAIVITSTDVHEWIAAARDLGMRGVRVITILMDAQSFGSPRSNEHLVTELAASGIPVYYVREGDDLAQALYRPYAEGVKTMAMGRHLDRMKARG